jgi:hypothetical protein
MDATNNTINTQNAYLQKVAHSLGQAVPIIFSQPFFDEAENRVSTSDVPTNLGVDGSDLFSLEGLQYYKRAGVKESFVTPDFLCDKWSPKRFKDKYDKVLYPINVLNWRPVSQLDSAVWLLNEGLAFEGIDRALVVLWIGNNDSSKAALGAGGKNPEFQPLPFDLIKKELNPLLALLLGSGQAKGLVSFEPYTLSAIKRNLTELGDFAEQYVHILDRIATETGSSGISYEVLALTLPYYSSVGYLMDSEDLEFYLRKVKPWYRVPASFKRVAPRGQPITDFLKGDRISLVTFGMMYALLSTGHSVAEVNKVLEQDGRQRDGLVLSEMEQRYIMGRIEGFNLAIRAAVAASGPKVHLVDIGKYLNDIFLGKEVIEVDGRVFNRKWIRGGGFCFDGVHPGYTGQAFIANFITKQMNEILGVDAPFQNLSEILALDPYIDRDGDGFAVGPDYQGAGFTKLLYLFKDPDDSNPQVQAVIPPDVWELISDVLLGEIIDIPAMRTSAKDLGLIPMAQ